MKAVFLDRDGTINKRLIDDYVKNPQEMELLEGAAEAISLFNQLGYLTIIITNQQGIGKKLMTIEDLEKVHRYMLSLLAEKNAHIDKIYFCPHLKEENCSCRKPKTGLLEQALLDFPSLDIQKSFFIGDSESDILAAKNFNLKSILLEQSNLFGADYCFPNLLSAARFISSL